MEEKSWNDIFPVGSKVRIKINADSRPGEEGTVTNCFRVVGSYWAVHVRFSENGSPYSYSPREVEPIETSQEIHGP